MFGLNIMKIYTPRNSYSVLFIGGLEEKGLYSAEALYRLNRGRRLNVDSVILEKSDYEQMENVPRVEKYWKNERNFLFFDLDMNEAPRQVQDIKELIRQNSYELIVQGLDNYAKGTEGDRGKSYYRPYFFAVLVGIQSQNPVVQKLLRIVGERLPFTELYNSSFKTLGQGLLSPAEITGKHPMEYSHLHYNSAGIAVENPSVRNYSAFLIRLK